MTRRAKCDHRVSDTASGAVDYSVRAHSGEITDIAICEDTNDTLVASSSRDRTIQLFFLTSGQLTLLQTLDEHAGSVTCLQFAKQGSQLLSCSADRTVVVREAISRVDNPGSLFVIARTITLKNSPTCMRLSLYDDVILLSTTDRCIQLVNIQTGRILSSFKASDTEGGDAVIMSSLDHLPSSTGSPIIAGVSSSDKSVRLYSEDGTLLARDWGHTEGVTDIAVVKSANSSDGRSSAKIVTVAADGTVFVWDTVPGRPVSSDSDQGLQVPSLLGAVSGPAAPPLRKVISHSELARFRRSKSVDLSENDPIVHTAATPTHKAPTLLRHKQSRLGAKPTPRLDPSPLVNLRNQLGGVGKADAKERQRSPSPPSPLPPPSPLRQRRPTHTRARPSTSGSMSASADKNKDSGWSKGESSGFGSVSASTEQLCRTLKAYRHRLEKASTGVASERLTELSNELDSTVDLVQKALRGRRGSTVEVEKELDKVSLASQPSWAEIDATEGGSMQDDDEATPKRRSEKTEASEMAPRCESPPDTSFVSAVSHQNSESSNVGFGRGLGHAEVSQKSTA